MSRFSKVCAFDDYFVSLVLVLCKLSIGLKSF